MLKTTLRWCLRLAILAIILTVFVSVIFTLAILVLGVIRLANPEFTPWLKITQDLVLSLIGIDLVGCFVIGGLWVVDFFEEPLY